MLKVIVGCVLLRAFLVTTAVHVSGMRRRKERVREGKRDAISTVTMSSHQQRVATVALDNIGGDARKQRGRRRAILFRLFRAGRPALNYTRLFLCARYPRPRPRPFATTRTECTDILNGMLSIDTISIHSRRAHVRVGQAAVLRKLLVLDHA